MGKRVKGVSKEQFGEKQVSSDYDYEMNIPWSEPCRKIGNEREVNDDEEGNMKV